jgi:heterodisulfide reductase subunit C
VHPVLTRLWQNCFNSCTVQVLFSELCLRLKKKARQQFFINSQIQNVMNVHPVVLEFIIPTGRDGDGDINELHWAANPRHYRHYTICSVR